MRSSPARPACARRSTSMRCWRGWTRRRGQRRSPRSRTVASGEIERACAGRRSSSQVRALAIEAFYSDFVAPGVDATGAWAEIDFNTPLATRLAKDWSVPGHRMNERFDVVVVGSGAGGGVVAGELAERGRSVLLLELGPHRTAADFTRWEAKATHDLWWPIRFALIDGGAGGAVGAARRPLRRRHDDDQHEGRAARPREGLAKWHEASGLVGSGGAPFGSSDLDAALRPGREAARRPRAQPTGAKSVHTVEPGFRALGARARARPLLHRRELHELRLVPAGLPDERGQVDAQHVHPRRLGGRPARAARRRARRAGRRSRTARRRASSTSTRRRVQRVSMPAPSSSPRGR